MRVQPEQYPEFRFPSCREELNKIFIYPLSHSFAYQHICHHPPSISCVVVGSASAGHTSKRKQTCHDTRVITEPSPRRCCHNGAHGQQGPRTLLLHCFQWTSTRNVTSVGCDAGHARQNVCVFAIVELWILRLPPVVLQLFTSRPRCVSTSRARKVTIDAAPGGHGNTITPSTTGRLKHKPSVLRVVPSASYCCGRLHRTG